MGASLDIDKACERVVRTVFGFLIDDSDPDHIPLIDDRAANTLCELLSGFEGAALVSALKTVGELAFYVFEELDSEVNGHKLLAVVARCLHLVPPEARGMGREPSDGGFAAFQGNASSPRIDDDSTDPGGPDPRVKAGPLARYALSDESRSDASD